MRLLDTLLLIGGPDSDRPLLRDILREEYNILEADGLEQALFLLEQNSSCIVGVIVDRPPPRTPEESFLSEAARRGLIGKIPMLALIPQSASPALEELAFSLGAHDVIPRPFSAAVIRRRVAIMVDLYRSNQRMLSLLNRQAETIRHTNEVMVDALSSVIEYRNTESGGHILRIRRFTEILLTEVERSCPEYRLTPEAVRNIASAAALHDIGKISIPDVILNKPGKLSPEEITVMRTHTTNGSKMVEMLSGATSEDYLRYAYNICRYHHERWDGNGYPEGLSGDDIPICAQVVGLADAFDALTTQRVYKPPIASATAVNMILNGDCGVFSPKLLTCFKHVYQQFMDLAREYADGRSPRSDDITLPLPAPQHPDHEMGSLQMSQLKYQAMLHYHEATVIEMDLGRNTFHVVYNPVPNFHPIPNTFPLSSALDRAALNNVHPDDVEHAQREYRFLIHDFFELGLHKHTAYLRIYSSAAGDYRPHRVTFLRLDMGDDAQRKAILVWQPLTALFPGEHPPPDQNTFRIPHQLMDSVICRRNDRFYTVISGANNLMDLLGYTGEDIRELFHDRFLEMILPEDREQFVRHVKGSLTSGVRTQSEYRVRRKDGQVVWILEKGCVLTADDGNEYFYGALFDNTASHSIRTELEAALYRSKIIIDHTDNIVFDWDSDTGCIHLPKNWADMFGYPPASNPMRESDLPNSRLHPDDLPSLRLMADAARKGKTFQTADLRIANSEGHYLWCRLRLTVLPGAPGAPLRAMGVLTNIDSAKRANLALKAQAQQDSLTGLLNKASAHSAMRSYLEGRDHPDCALLMIDLDNFKGVNDRFGHLFGDNVLTRTAAAIRRLFRGGDIIGRVGGDEFIVLMKDVQDEQLVQQRCTLLLDELAGLFRDTPQKLEISCSVGAALSPQHGTSFQELFRHADHALYFSKQQGKHRFTVYQSLLELPARELGRNPTPIDSNDQSTLTHNSLVRMVFHRLSTSDDIIRSIQDVLSAVGQYSNVSRIYIFENNDANTHCSNTFEWCNEGISPQIDNLQNISYIDDIPGWESNYDENGVLFWTDISKVDPIYRAILEPQGVMSMLHCAIRENGVFRGYIGLDECVSNRIWTQEQIDILTFLAEVVAAFLLKKRSKDKTDAMAANLHSILDSQSSWCYVIDPLTYRLRYINGKTQSAVPDLVPGDVCYEKLMHRTTPCPNCPISRMGDKGFARTLIHSLPLDAPVVAESAQISWNGSPACLITCREPD